MSITNSLTPFLRAAATFRCVQRDTNVRRSTACRRNQEHGASLNSATTRRTFASNVYFNHDIGSGRGGGRNLIQLFFCRFCVAHLRFCTCPAKKVAPGLAEATAAAFPRGIAAAAAADGPPIPRATTVANLLHCTAEGKKYQKKKGKSLICAGPKLRWMSSAVQRTNPATPSGTTLHCRTCTCMYMCTRL